MEVGVRELKKHLSAYLDRAAAGEVVIVTDRGHPKARLMPLSSKERIAQGIREGWITPPRHEGPPAFDHPRFVPTRPIQEVLDEDRGE
jgi:prevent-host-death family protein